MTWTDWAQMIAAVLAGVATAIPLVVKLVELVEQCRKEKNWKKALDLVMNLMDEAEVLMDGCTGEAKKLWVMAGVESMASIVDYDIDLEAVSKMVDELCAFTKRVNAPESEGANE